ncbi:nucleotidyl transferase AbiEii/AbiGii toxin family protein [Nodularia sp. UHCC 0506]|uniref:nucleotidyl transferase AbiEii/AbiGii toxin family protein n=1 Tax=Nodularia sp. UHCC 0506 TaxID=3110243 RepID=UPI002B216B9E|nr:nucleotidyl transferase AbiEii/AbiGii toxin family protein [Nodularia sp. UHCC 0506]MEA5517269.1 nucleotidyl transferase AbiEii/AbiGii toxin family protein [Nodularia sp. UHCC 0506]
MSASIDPSLLEIIASDLGVDPSFVEKDWYAMRIIAALITVDKLGIKLVFAGGTSLSKGFALIKRFSEDLDFKVILPVSKHNRQQRSLYKEQILDVIRNSSLDWSLDEVKARNNNRQFSCNISYKRKFDQSIALRPYIKLDINFISPVLPVEEKTLISFISQAMEQSPEVPLIACISPLETAAEKLSALTWRVLTRNRESEQDDPSLIRHLYDLTALNQTIEDYQDFSSLVSDFMQEDFKENRGKIQSLAIPTVEFLPKMLYELESDPIYNDEYQQFVTGMSYATEDECPTFEQCIKTIKSIITNFELA